MISLSSRMTISFSFRPALINLLPPPPVSLPSAGTPFAAKTHLLHLCSATSSNANRPESSGFDGSSIEKQVPEDFPTMTVLGSNGKDDNSPAVSSNEFYVTPAPGRMGYLAAVERFLKVMAMVWAGSQVTKLMRAGGALALAPVVDRGLSWFTIKFGFESQGKAFVAIAGLCFGLAFLMFVVVTLLSA